MSVEPRPKALVVDDSRTMRRIVCRHLAELGFDTVEAGDGAAALGVLEQDPVEVVCVDQNMPVMDGVTFISRVRARPQWRTVALVMVTTEAGQDQVLRALAAGAHEYLIKPFTADALESKLALLGVLPTMQGLS